MEETDMYELIDLYFCAYSFTGVKRWYYIENTRMCNTLDSARDRFAKFHNVDIDSVQARYA